jgi:catechol 2,3-dioxygenase-like lactoylglutathione lyase family enzyme
MKLDRIHHASLCVTDLARARKFYEETLGLEEIPRPDFPFEGAWFRVGANEIHLIVMPEGTAPDTPLNALHRHVAFAVADVGVASGELRDRGYEVLGGGEGATQAWVKDEDGNIIELISP